MDLKSRKLLAAAILFVTGTTALFTGHASFPEWSNYIIFVFGIYVGGNVGEHATKNIKKMEK